MSATPRATTDRARFGVGAAPSRGVSRGRSFALPIAFSLALALGGCALSGDGRSGVSATSGASGGSGIADDPADRVQLQAREALERWERAVDASGGASIEFVGEVTSQIGTWADESAKAALDAGLVDTVVTLSNAPPARAEVKWLDGAKVEVNLLSARAALGDLIADAPGTCAGCTPLVITDANLATELVETSDGPAEAPVWVFTIDGTDVRVTRVAVDDSVTVTPPPWNAANPPIGVSIDAATGSADSKQLTVAFTGAVNGRDQPCGADYVADAVESELAVVVVITESRNPAGGACDLTGKVRTAKLTLAKVLGDRAVLEVRQGLPVPVAAP